MERRIPRALASKAKRNKVCGGRRNEQREVRIKIGAHCGPLPFFKAATRCAPGENFIFFRRCCCLLFYSYFISSFFFSSLLAVRGRANSRSLISFTVQRGFALNARREPLSFSCIMPNENSWAWLTRAIDAREIRVSINFVGLFPDGTSFTRFFLCSCFFEKQ